MRCCGACTNQADRRAGAFRGARSRAEQDTVELRGDGGRLVGEPGVVIAPHVGLDTQLAEVLHQVEHEAVVVVDDQDPHRVRLPSDVRAHAAQYPTGPAGCAKCIRTGSEWPTICTSGLTSSR